MKQANELRIGNTITHQNRNGIYLVTVTELLKNGVNVKTGMQLGEWFLRYEEIKGTPLTEEWLLKFGAKEILRLSDNYTRYDLNGIHFSICPERDFFIEYVHQIPIKHVHTLQNFYFATRQQELVLPTVPEATKPAL